MTTQQTPNEDLPKKEEGTPEGQPSTQEPAETENEKRLRNEFTQARQREINYAVKLAEKDKKSILDIDDKKTQDKVIKELYGLNNIDEVKLIHGDTFYEEKSDDKDVDDDRLARLEKEIKLGKYKQTQDELTRAIEDIKSKNPIAFEDESVEEKLRDEIKFISSELSVDERVKRAAKLVVGNTDDLWRSLKQAGGYTPAKKETKEECNKKSSETQSEIEGIFSRRIPKK